MVEFSESAFQLLLNALHEGICYLNANGVLEYYNPPARTHWELDEQGKTKLIQQGPVARAFAGEQVYHEIVQRERDCSLLVNALPLYKENSIFQGVAVISQDISEHVLLEQQAHSALNVLLEATIDIYNIQDVDEALRRAAALIPQLPSVDNSIALRVDITTGKLIPIALFGESQRNSDEWHAELAAIQFSTEHMFQTSPTAYFQALRLARTIKVDFSVERIYPNPHHLHAAIYAPVVANNQVIGLLGAERHRPLDTGVSYFPQWSQELLTALARLTGMAFQKTSLLTSLEKARAENEELQRLLQQKEEFLALTAHELKNPLTAILGQAQVLRRRLQRSIHIQPHITQDTHDLIKGLDSIENQTRKITSMLNTLMDVSRIDLDRLELDIQEIDLLSLVRQAMKEQLPLANKHELRLFVDKQPVPILVDKTTIIEPISIQADSERLDQIITNLLGNAIKYSPQGGPITVSIERAISSVTISVADQGIGVPLEAQSRLTERFYRAENAQGSSSKGLGLGLYLVNILVQKHNGQLSVQSAGIPGKGSVFSITLPYRHL